MTADNVSVEPHNVWPRVPDEPGDQSVTVPAEGLTLEDITQREQQRMARILRLVLYVAFGACALVLAMGISTESRWTVILSVGAIGLFMIPMLLTSTRYLRAAAFLTALIPLSMVTLTAATGGGLQDLAVGGYAVIIIFGGMTLKRTQFGVLVVLLLGAVVSVELNQHLMLIPLRVDDTPPGFASVAISSMVIVVTAICVWLLAEDSREGRTVAYAEIERRMHIEHELAELSLRDSLTGAYGRRAFDEEIERLRSTRRYPISVLIADIDDLKQVNDTLGHSLGDKLIADAADVLASVTRGDDMLARIGGDEFAILLPETDSHAADEIVDRIEMAIDNHNAVSREPHVRLSIGVATAISGGLPSALIVADRAMYEQKAAKKVAS